MSDWADVKRVPAAELAGMVGNRFTSRWLTVDQARIDAFAKVTEDELFIHVDPERAKATQFGGTIAHGFLTLSLLSAMAYSALPRIEGAVHGVNYGFDRVRFVHPVPAREAGCARISRSTRRRSVRRANGASLTRSASRSKGFRSPRWRRTGSPCR